jgi:hypothetical protein
MNEQPEQFEDVEELSAAEAMDIAQGLESVAPTPALAVGNKMRSCVLF